MTVHREVRPAGLAAPAARYAHAVETTGASRWLHTSGVVPTAPDGSVPPTIGEQAAQVWRTLRTLLDDAGMTPSDVVSVTTYVVDGEDLATVMAARDAALEGHRPASTLVIVPRLAQEAWLMEIAVVASA